MAHPLNEQFKSVQGSVWREACVLNPISPVRCPASTTWPILTYCVSKLMWICAYFDNLTPGDSPYPKYNILMNTFKLESWKSLCGVAVQAGQWLKGRGRLDPNFLFNAQPQLHTWLILTNCECKGWRLEYYSAPILNMVPPEKPRTQKWTSQLTFKIQIIEIGSEVVAGQSLRGREFSIPICLMFSLNRLTD